MPSPAPLTLDEVLDPAWLGMVVGRSVLSVDVVEHLKTVATKVRLVVTLDDGSTEHLCVKGMLDDGPLTVSAAQMSQAEVHFYRSIAPFAGLGTVPVHYVGLDAATGHGLLVMSDVVALGGRFLTALEPYTPAQTAASLTELASLHASHWAGRDLDRHDWLKSRLDAFVRSPLRTEAELQTLMDDERTARLGPRLRDSGRLVAALSVVAAHFADAPGCLVHGDAHAGNVYVQSGAATIIDWQIIQRGSWALDVAYHVAAVLTIDDRRERERDLLDHYLAELGRFGVTPPPRDTAWELYRRALVYGYYLWSITRRVEPPVIGEFATRLGTAIEDLETYEALGI